MYKEEFKPLFREHGITGDKLSDLQRENLNPCKDIESRYEHEIEELMENIDKLKLRIEGLEKEKEELLKDNRKFAEELNRRDYIEDLVNKLSTELLELLTTIKAKLKEEFIDVVLDLIKKILMADSLPKEEALVQALSALFESGIELKGEVNLYLSPKDFQLMEKYFEVLKQKISNPLQLNPVMKKELKDGEFIIETQKFWIERRYEDLILDVLKDIRDERGL
ncbi:MAG: FliH/SctL family protein [Aquificaceae bacterium]